MDPREVVRARGGEEDSLRHMLQLAITGQLDPAALEARRRARVEREVLEHRLRFWSGAAAHLVRCGMGEEDAQRVTAELQLDWARKRGSQLEPLHVASRWWRSMQRWRRRRGRQKSLLVLCGVPGTGKTATLGRVMLWHRLRYWRGDWGRRVWTWPSASAAPIYVSAYTLSRDIFSQSSRELEERLHAAPLVCVDELGLESALSGPYLGLLQLLVLRRTARGKPTVVAGNMTEAELRERYQLRVDRRVSEEGVFVDMGTVRLSSVEPAP